MPLLSMHQISKAFNGVTVLDQVELEVERGEVHALLGENGAGKSTLMNILTGTIPLDSGSIEFDGRPLVRPTIRKTEELGIAFVHQELNLFNDLKVFENIFICKELSGFLGHLKKKEMISRCEELFSRLGVEIDPTALVADLKPSDKQLLEISKALFFKARLLILDEPTTALNTEEVEHLFSIVGGLKAQGISFIFISHKMPEIFAYSDRYTVFRNGRFIASGKIADTSPEEVTSLMVGHNAALTSMYQPRELGEVVLKADHVSGPGFHDVSFELRRGEIVGMTGLQGCGSSEFLQSLFGAAERTEGTVSVHGTNLAPSSIHAAMQAGVGFLPANRKENSVIPDQNILENMYISEHTLSALHFHIHNKEELARYHKFHELLNIKAASEKLPVTSLSGGNQQKIFIARWLNTKAQVLLFDNPTQGIDVGAKDEIYRLILKLASEGQSIVVNTLEIPELMKVADRCLVFCDGTIASHLSHDEIEEHKIMLYSTGALKQKGSEDWVNVNLKSANVNHSRSAADNSIDQEKEAFHG
ncbi:MAG: sugar ABC transporter ATP-binding protein [Proteobacteria bacterium]|uniref:Sugar ABC transporter ATP-binding protein n=1 Tax=Candidatus Avisuccinivibrio stercorigallinarum TaxID=2840704 RepID=A0A9D9DD15_9GAMM|nr:sugar ABC transporter ATP-binding protein [Candidatus Avisuccinivibrio stercorigallinarum]